MNALQQIPELHKLYIEITGIDIRLNPSREREWFDWLRAGFTAADLRLLVADLKRGIREQRRLPGSLKFSNLIRDVDWFEENLAEAKARARNFRPSTDKASVLRATGRDPAPPPLPARTPEQIMAAEKAFQEFLALKNKL